MSDFESSSGNTFSMPLVRKSALKAQAKMRFASKLKLFLKCPLHHVEYHLPLRDVHFQKGEPKNCDCDGPRYEIEYVPLACVNHLLIHQLHPKGKT